MPSLAQMYANCNAASYFSRTAHIWAKLNSAGFKIYTKILKERSGFFIKFDETFLTLLPGQVSQEYPLPTDLTQVVHLAERASSTENWHPMAPANGLENVLVNQLASFGLFSLSGFGSASPFSYYGPFLDAGDTEVAAAAQTQKIRIAPIPDQNRFVQLVYTAKWVPIVNQNSLLMMPEEGTMAMESMATAELLVMNNDSMAADYAQQAAGELDTFLDWVRTRQTQEPPTIQPFMDF